MRRLAPVFVCVAALFALGGGMGCVASEREADPASWKMFDRRIGMFVHWGIYSVGAWHEQEQMRRGIARAEYEKYAQDFKAEQFNADELVAEAKTLGADYLVFTTKHHDGFCMWDTKTTDYNSVKGAPAGRDFVREIAEACKRGGIKLGFYYSNPDWHNPNAYNPLSTHQIELEKSDIPDMKAYKAYVIAQVTELLTNYGEIVCFFWDIPPHIEDAEMNRLVCRLQPGIMINDRGWGKGDYSTPERNLPAGAAFTNLTEACDSVGVQSWGCRANEDYRTIRDLTRSVDNILARGGNFLLNVGPKADGTLTAQAKHCLKGVGDWYRRVQEAFRDVTIETGLVADTKCIVTKRGNTLYLHYSEGLTASGLNLSPFNRRPTSATLLNTGKAVDFELAVMPSGWWQKVTHPVLHLMNLPAEELNGEAAIIRLCFD